MGVVPPEALCQRCMGIVRLGPATPSQKRVSKPSMMLLPFVARSMIITITVTTSSAPLEPHVQASVPSIRRPPSRRATITFIHRCRHLIANIMVNRGSVTGSIQNQKRHTSCSRASMKCSCTLQPSSLKTNSLFRKAYAPVAWQDPGCLEALLQKGLATEAQGLSRSRGRVFKMMAAVWLCIC